MLKVSYWPFSRGQSVSCIKVLYCSTSNSDTAWFFASTSPGTIDRTYTVIELEMHVEHLESLFEQGLAIKEPIINVVFQGEHIWFHPDTFDFINEKALFRPFSGKI